jgi:acetolactate synthase-1/2/3 large subunit
MTAAELFVKCLEAEGVDLIFGLPGEENLDLLNALSRSPIRFVSVRHEQGAAFMADVYGRVTGRAGVCLATLGPGATNLATGIADANLDHAPLVAITGQAGLERVHKESHQYVNIVEAFGPLTKWNTRVERASAIPEIVHHAFKTAQAEKPGACHIELPEDVASEPAEGAPLASRRARRPSPDRPSLRAAAEVIDRAPPHHPGRQRRHPGRASRELVAFAERTGIPVANTFMAKGAMPAGPRALAAVDRLAGPRLRVLRVRCRRSDRHGGVRPVEYAPYHWNPCGDKAIVHIDFTQAETDAMYQPEVEIVSDVREALELLCAEVTQAHDRGYPAPPAGHPRRPRARCGRRLRADETSPRAADLRRALDRRDVVISDVGAHTLLVARLYPAYEPNTVLISNGFAAMGIALPGAIGAKLADPSRRVVAVSGMADFDERPGAETRCGSACVQTLVFRDEGYGLIRGRSSNSASRRDRVRQPRPVKLAESFGAVGYRVEKADDPRAVSPTPGSAYPRSSTPIDYSEGSCTPITVKSSALRRAVVKVLPANQRGAPGQAAAEGRQHDPLSRSQAPLGDRVVERDREGRGRGVAVAGERQRRPLGRDAQAPPDLLQDAGVGLVKEEVVDLIQAETVRGDPFPNRPFQGPHRGPENRRAVEAHGVTARRDRLGGRGLAAAPGGEMDQGPAGAVGVDRHVDHAAVRRAVGEDHGPRAIAEQNRAGRIVLVDEPRLDLAGREQDRPRLTGAEKRLGDREAVEKAGARGGEVEGGALGRLEFALHLTRRRREPHVGRRGGDEDQIQIGRLAPGGGQGGAGRDRGEVGGGLVALDPAARPDPGATENPPGRNTESRLKALVADDAVGQADPGSGDHGAHGRLPVGFGARLAALETFDHQEHRAHQGEDEVDVVVGEPLIDRFREAGDRGHGHRAAQNHLDQAAFGVGRTPEADVDREDQAAGHQRDPAVVAPQQQPRGQDSLTPSTHSG